MWIKISALCDPDGANLNRVQIIKGESHERVYDVAVAGDRTTRRDGRAREAVGNTVDIEKATYTNSISVTGIGGP